MIHGETIALGEYILQIDKVRGTYFSRGLNLISLDPSNCATSVSVTGTMVMVVCPPKGIVEVFRQTNLQRIYMSPADLQFSTEWTFLSFEKDSQLYMFF